MKQKFTVEFSLFKLRVLAGVFLGLVASLAVFAGVEKSIEVRDASLQSKTLHPSTIAARTFISVTPDGGITDYRVESKVARIAARGGESLVRPSGNTLWMVDDPNAIADGVAIDSKNVWAAWTLGAARLSIYPINGNGTEAWHFSSFNSGSSGVAAAKASDRLGFLESNEAGTDFRQQGFTSNSNGTPDWSFRTG